MRFYTVAVSILTALFSLSAFATSGTTGLPSVSDVRTYLNRTIPNGQQAQLGTQVIDKKVQLLKAHYTSSLGNFNTSSVTVKLLDVDGKDAILPINAVVKQVLIDVLTAPTASAVAGYTLPTISVGVNNLTDLKTSTLYSSFSGRVAGEPVGSAATMVKVLATSAVTASIYGGSALNGDMNIFVEYYLSN